MPATRNYIIHPIGSTVCLVDYSDNYAVHTGTVTNVKMERNGYPTTTVNFPSFRGERVYGVEMLLTPDAVEAAVAAHQANLLAYGW